VKTAINEECEEICGAVKNLAILPAPFYSTLMDGCLTAGQDISQGAVYNNFGVHGTGLSTAADSLAALQQAVFEAHLVSGGEMRDALERDFAGFDRLYHYVRYQAPKLGDGTGEAQTLAARLLGWFAEGLKGRKNERGGIFRPGTGSAMFYLRHAEELEASADGRRKNEPFGTNFSPGLYVRSKGPFSVVRSFAQLPTELAMNGGPLTMEFHSTVFRTQEGIESAARLVKRYMDMGGHQLQLNAVNRNRLLEAQKNPDGHRDLIVRIWGWSAYFVELDAEYQEHLIKRQEFAG
jgi:formate C-acetyltransferase